MAGHSKWHNIKHKKAKEDAIKGKAFTRVSKEISVCVKNNGADLATNAKLRLLLDKAKDVNMPKDTVERAIKKGLGQLEGVHYEESRYEAYAPHNVGLVIEALTDNKNRTAADLHHLVTKFGGRWAEKGSVSWMFDQKGQVLFVNQNYNEDQILEALLDYNVEDIKIDDEMVTVICAMTDLDVVRQACETLGYKVKEANLAWIAQNPVTLNQEQEDAVFEFLNRLEEMEDIQEIYTNLG